MFGGSQFGTDTVFFQNKLVLVTAAPFPGMIQGVFKITSPAGHDGSGPQREAQDFFVAVMIYAAFAKGEGPDVTVGDKHFRNGGGKQVRNASNIRIHQVSRGIGYVYFHNQAPSTRPA
jgi:hypothetical protein